MPCKNGSVRRSGLILTAVLLAFSSSANLAQAQTTVGFEIGAVNVAGSSASIKVVLNAASTDAVAVQYATQDGTAVSPGDYTATTGTVVVPAGFTSQTFTINGINSAAAGKNFTATLANPVNATLGTSLVAITIGAAAPPGGGGGSPPGGGGSPPSGGTQPTVQFEKICHTVSESVGSVMLNVVLSELPTAPVSVKFATKDGSALSTEDYTATSGTLNFAVGETIKTITVLMTDDTNPEDNEDFTVELSDAKGATLGDISTATVQVIDNDDCVIVLFSPDSIVIDIMENRSVTASVEPLEAVDFVEFAPADPAIASVSGIAPNLIIVGIAEGATAITAICDGEEIGSLMVQVKAGKKAVKEEWSNKGAQSLVVNGLPWPPGKFTAYVSPGASLAWVFSEIVDQDTVIRTFDDGTTKTAEEPDDQVQLKLQIDSCNFQDETAQKTASNWKQFYRPSGKESQGRFIVPITAKENDTFEFSVYYFDSRAANHPRHDPPTKSLSQKWTFVVSSECPAKFKIDSLVDITKKGVPGPKQSAGVWLKTVKAIGDAPNGRTSWKGTAVTETITTATAVKGDENKFVPGFLNLPPSQGLTFYFGDDGNDNDTFKDQHGSFNKVLVLKAGVVKAQAYRMQTYRCGGKSCVFQIMRTYDRVDAGTASERITITVSVAPADEKELE